MGVSLHNIFSLIWTSWRWVEEALGKAPPLGGVLKQYYGTYVRIRFQRWLEPMRLQIKRISYTTQQYIPFQEEEETAPQMLEPCVPVLLIWGYRLKPKWKMGSVSSPISGTDHWCGWPIRVTLKYLGLHDEEVNKTNVSGLITAS